MGNYKTIQEAQAALRQSQYVGLNQDGTFGIWDKDPEGKWIAACVYAYQAAGIEFPAALYGLGSSTEVQSTPQIPTSAPNTDSTTSVEQNPASAIPNATAGDHATVAPIAAPDDPMLATPGDPASAASGSFTEPALYEAPSSAPGMPAPPSGDPIDLGKNDPLNQAKKKNRKPLIIGACVIAALIVFACIGGAVGSNGAGKSSSSKPSTSTQKSEEKSERTESAEKAVSKKELDSAIELYDGTDLTGYTDASASSFATALEEAKEISAKENVTQKEVDSAAKTLGNAAGALEERVEPVTFSGTGADVIDIPSNLEISLVTASYSGGSNFVIWSLDSSMENLDLLVNTIGAYEGTTITGMASGTAKHLQVESSGDWSITLTPINQATKADNGSSYYGDNVVIVGASGAKKLSFTNDGSSNFIVYGIGSSSADLLVNEIGSYSGTVPYKNYTLLIVQSSGTWTVSWE